MTESTDGHVVDKLFGKGSLVGLMSHCDCIICSVPFVFFHQEGGPGST